MPEVIIIDTRKPQETKTIMLAPEQQLNNECLLGRDERCSIVLDDTLASRTHGKIAFRNGGYYYSDLGSRNGSKVNNVDAQLNQEYLLKPSDTIALGNHLLWIKAIAGEEAPAVPQSMSPAQYMPLATIDTTTLETWTQGTKQVRCVQIIDETIDVKTFTFVCEPPVKFNYQPGQFITLSLNIDGKNVKRSYSISSTPSRPHSIEVTVKRVPAPRDEPSAPPGLVSNWLHDNMKVGSQIEINAPMGKFTNFANPSSRLLLISAGSGITPMMSMSRWICDTISNVDIVFLHSARSPEDIIFRQELEMMTARYPKFKLAITVTRPVPGQPWYGYTGRINETILPAISPDYKDRTVYVCGPNPFMEATKELLAKINFPMENYYEESFGGAKKKKKAAPAASAAPQGDRTSIIQPPPVQPIQPPIQQPPVQQPPAYVAPQVQPTFVTPPAAQPVAPPPQQPAPQQPAPAASSGPMVVLAKSGQEISCDGEEAILDVAEGEGADLPFGCRMGACGACKVKKVSGDVVYDDDVDCEDGFIYTCVARPVNRVVIEA
ncbi:FHA domain-containing protein [Waterburya agarophytonicola K14]|uniref:Ferredoxin--NADP reductase n=1 Tax=Waterburya agarophytonicola KI4 TaxID=2874699 RepID=A0A964BRH5_9CYAN|nr:FAD-binding oxidoreductase [Waterburya agarophytonicola]MCC0177397.1 FHA domain-containing protein [Waterburya agarophytonicola KI4]